MLVLVDMGFEDFNKNLELCNKYKNDLNSAITQLQN